MARRTAHTAHDDRQLDLFAAPPAPPVATATPTPAPAPTSPPPPFTLGSPDPPVRAGARTRTRSHAVTAAAEISLEARFEPLRALAARLPADVRFGTSSWSFPGWHGIVYPRNASESELARDGLSDYVRHPILRTVGIDRGYYAPIPAMDLERYAGQLPDGFPCCAKAPERITTPVMLGHGRGTAGDVNPDYLSADRFMDLMGQTFLDHFKDHTGPFVFEFPPVPSHARPAPTAFAERLDAFLEKLPRTFQYAIELRDKSLLTPAYATVLRRHGAAHTYNYWSRMPMPAAQAERVPVAQAPFVVIRLLLRPGTAYDARKEAFAPFDRIADESPEMRADVITLIRAAMLAGRPVFVLVNNKAEGSAPRTIEALAEQLAQGLAPPVRTT